MYHRSWFLLGACVLSFTFISEPATAEEGARVIEEVIVTARRREETIQSVPVAVSVMSQDSIDRRGFMDGLNLAATVPGMTAQAQVGNRHTVLFNIRAQSFTYGNLFSAVIPYFAETPITGGPQSPGISQGVFFDLENVQVLRGPQGTLFGRVTNGGSILIQPQRPDFDNVNGYVEVQAGDYDMTGFKGAINIPMGETLAVRLAAETRRRNGYTENRSTGKKMDDQDWMAGRVGILWRPTDRFENYLVWNHYTADTNGTGVSMSGFNNDALAANIGQAVGAAAAAIPNFAVLTDPAAFGAAVQGILGTPGVRGQIMSTGFADMDSIFNPGGDTPTFYSALQTQLDAGIRSTDFGLHPEFGTHPSGSPHYYRRRDNYFANHTTFELNDQLTIKNILGYTKIRERSGTDYDGFEIIYIDTPHTFLPFIYQEQWSEEIQLQGTGLADGKLDFIVGAYFDEQKPAEKNGNENYTINLLLFQRNDLQQPTTKSRAAFAQIGYDLSSWVEGLRFNAGVRYTEDKINTLNLSLLELTGGTAIGFPNGIPTPHGICADYASQVTLNPALTGGIEGIPFLTSQCFNLKDKFDAWTYNVGFDYQFNPNAMAYISLRRGYRPGGFNSTSLGDNPAVAFFDPEYALTTEVGLKADWTLGAIPVRTNAAAYYIDYTDIQKSITLTVNGIPASVIQNTASASVWGFEFEGNFFLTEGLTIGLMYAYTNADFDKSDTEDVDCPPDRGLAIVPGPGFCTKNEFAFTPEHMFSVDARYSFPLGQLGQFSIGATYSWKDDHYLVDRNWVAPFGEESGYGVLNLDARLADIGGYPVDLSFFMTNVTDEEYRVGSDDIWAAGSQGMRADFWSDPRMWGLALRYRLGE